jgi:hypothetical protein
MSASASTTPKIVITPPIAPKNVITAFAGITLDEPKIQPFDEPKIQLYTGPFDERLEIEMMSAREIYGNDLDQNLFAKLHYAENNMNLEDLNYLTSEEIKTFNPEQSQAMLDKLAACNCCKVHSRDKPKTFKSRFFNYTNKDEDKKENYYCGIAKCLCYCRHSARLICDFAKTDTETEIETETEASAIAS